MKKPPVYLKWVQVGLLMVLLASLVLGCTGDLSFWVVGIIGGAFLVLTLMMVEKTLFNEIEVSDGILFGDDELQIGYYYNWAWAGSDEDCPKTPWKTIKIIEVSEREVKYQWVWPMYAEGFQSSNPNELLMGKVETILKGDMGNVFWEVDPYNNWKMFTYSQWVPFSVAVARGLLSKEIWNKNNRKVFLSHTDPSGHQWYTIEIPNELGRIKNIYVRLSQKQFDLIN